MKTVRKFAAITFVLFLLLSITCPVFAEEAGTRKDPNAATFELGIANSEAGSTAAVSVDSILYLELTVSMPENYNKDPYSPYFFECSFELPSGLTLIDNDPDPEKSAYDITFTLINEDKEFVLRDSYSLSTIMWNDGRFEVRIGSRNTRDIHSAYGAKEEYMVYPYSKFRFLIGCSLEALAPSASEGIGVTFHFAHTNLTPTGEDDKKIDVPSQTVRIFNYALSAAVTDSKDGTPLAGAKFYLQNEDGLYFSDGLCWVENELMATSYISDADGLISFTGLGDGEYTLVQAAAPKGYKLPEAPVALEVRSVCDENGVQTVSVTVGDVTVENAPFSVQNEKEFPIVPVAVGSAAAVIVLIIAVVLILRRKRN